MKRKWCDLFILGLIQCNADFNLTQMLQAMDTHLCKCVKFGEFIGFILLTLNYFHFLGELKDEKYEEVSCQINFLLAFVQKTHHLKLSNMEYAYLKTITFTSSDMPPKDNLPRLKLTAESERQHSHLSKILYSQACLELFELIQKGISSNDGERNARVYL